METTNQQQSALVPMTAEEAKIILKWFGEYDENMTITEEHTNLMKRIQELLPKNPYFKVKVDTNDKDAAKLFEMVFSSIFKPIFKSVDVVKSQLSNPFKGGKTISEHNNINYNSASKLNLKLEFSVIENEEKDVTKPIAPALKKVAPSFNDED